MAQADPDRRAIVRRGVTLLDPRLWHRIGPVVSLLPALTLIVVLFGTAISYGVTQSLGYLPAIDQRTVSLAAYRAIVGGDGVVAAEFWPALGFSLWVSLAATALSAAGAFGVVALFPRGRADRVGLTVLHLNLAFPHLVWAIALLLLLGQSGLLARFAATVGLIAAPADFPVLVRDRFGLGIIIHYATKEIPFLSLIVLGILRAQPEGYELVAANLGATPWQRLRHVTLPLVLPGLTAGALLVFAFTFGAYEVPAILGVRYPRMLAVVAFDLFANSDLRVRAAAMAIGVIMATVTIAVAGLGRMLIMRRAS